MVPTGIPHEHPQSVIENDLPNQIDTNGWVSHVASINPDRLADAGQFSFEAQLPPWVMDVEDFDFNIFGSPMSTHMLPLEASVSDLPIVGHNSIPKANINLKDLYYFGHHKLRYRGDLQSCIS